MGTSFGSRQTLCIADFTTWPALPWGQPLGFCTSFLCSVSRTYVASLEKHVSFLNSCSGFLLISQRSAYAEHFSPLYLVMMKGRASLLAPLTGCRFSTGRKMFYRWPLVKYYRPARRIWNAHCRSYLDKQLYCRIKPNISSHAVGFDSKISRSIGNPSSHFRAKNGTMCTIASNSQPPNARSERLNWQLFPAKFL